MKLLITLLALSIGQSAFAEGAWKIACKSESGISFFATNGESKISIPQKNSKGISTVVTEEVAIEDYDFGFENSRVKVYWLGTQEIIKSSLENVCRRDLFRSNFRQLVEIRRSGQETLKVNVVCNDEVLTSSGAEIDQCLK